MSRHVVLGTPRAGRSQTELGVALHKCDALNMLGATQRVCTGSIARRLGTRPAAGHWPDSSAPSPPLCPPTHASASRPRMVVSTCIFFSASPLGFSANSTMRPLQAGEAK